MSGLVWSTTVIYATTAASQVNNRKRFEATSSTLQITFALSVKKI